MLTAWARERGLELAPHGKTTMSPELWHRLDAGCWGITLATPWQVQVARSAGIDRIILANELADPVAIEWLSAELDAHPAFEFACWVDSVAGVALLAADGVAPDRRAGRARGPKAGGRARGGPTPYGRWRMPSRHPRDCGCAGWPGTRARIPTTACAATCARLRRCSPPPADRFHEPVITAGGSRYFDAVAEELSGCARDADRAGRGVPGA